MTVPVLISVVTAGYFAGGCGGAGVPDPVSGSGVFPLESPSFKNGGGIPARHVCERQGGQNLSPALVWRDVPKSTTGFAVIMDDESPPCGRGDSACRHWMVYNLPASVTSLSEGMDVAALPGVTVGKAYNGVVGYAGPCPPNAHVYTITVYALGEGMPVIPGGTPMTRSMFRKKYGETILAESSLTGTWDPTGTR